MDFFRFKKFQVKNTDSAMRVGTDGVLLGAWMNILPSDRNMLDIGTGCGVIALMAAQRSDPNVKITAIDIDYPSILEAAFNFENSLWKEKLSALNYSLQIFADLPLLTELKFDLIFTNPPYFIDSLKAPTKNRSNARHTDTLSYDEIILASFRLLRDEGRLALILPSDEATEFIKLAHLAHIGKDTQGKQLILSRRNMVSTYSGKRPKRYLMEFVLTDMKNHTPISLQEESLFIQDENGFSHQYKELTKDFYLKF